MQAKKPILPLSVFVKWAVPLLLIVFIQVVSFFPNFIERNFSTRFYPSIAKIIRWFTRLLPFSVGDVFYFIIALIVLIKLIKFFVQLFKRKLSWKTVGLKLLATVKTLLWIYIFFNFLWGLNYYRTGIATQLQLNEEKYSTDDLCVLTSALIEKANESRLALSKDSVLPEQSLKNIYATASSNYKLLEQQFPFLRYKNPSIKNSMYNKWAPYFGFTGYYNPFSGEAQLRYDVPRILIPYTASHEIAHQLGYASETEANFVGYLAASNSTDNYFKYSVYLDMYRYARLELFLRNTLPDTNIKLDSLVKMDLRNINRFFLKEKNRISPAVMNLYDAYLKANNQHKGVDSYNEVIGLLIAYQKQTGKL